MVKTWIRIQAVRSTLSTALLNSRSCIHEMCAICRARFRPLRVSTMQPVLLTDSIRSVARSTADRILALNKRKSGSLPCFAYIRAADPSTATCMYHCLIRTVPVGYVTTDAHVAWQT